MSQRGWWHFMHQGVARIDDTDPMSSVYVNDYGLVVFEMNASAAEWVSEELGRDGVARELQYAAQQARIKRHTINGTDEEDAPQHDHPTH